MSGWRYKRVGVKVELGVQGFDVAVAFQNQRVDFDQAGVGVHVDLVQLLQHIHGLGGRGCWHANGVGQFFGLRVGQAQRGVDDFGDDFLGRVMRHAFNVHAAFAGCDHGDALAGAVGHSRYVIFFLDVRAVFNQQAAHFLAHQVRSGG